MYSKKSARACALSALLALTMTSCAPTDPVAPPAPKLMTWGDLLARPKPVADKSFIYGSDPYQVVDLWLPRGDGPHPVVLLVHGGCWTTKIADRTLMNYLAGDLRTRGYAVWNIDYRGVDRPGGGYPGTFLDAGAAADALRGAAAAHRLDLKRIVAVGHSAGGHLALWLAARPRLPANSPLRSADPLRIPAVISLGGLPDLEEAATPPGSGCGTEVIAKLVGSGRADIYADTSLPRLAPIEIDQMLVNGTDDRIIPTVYASSYAGKMRGKGDPVSIDMIPATGHVELVAPSSKAWSRTLELIFKTIGRE